MASPKDVLVVTTSSIEGLKVKSYLKPVSAHIVAGTNLFSDFFAGLTDVFGGRSQTYQKQLVSLYDEAIERVKVAAYEIGANAIVGLSIDMDEISGKGKSMFMLSAVGTAVVIEKETTIGKTSNNSEAKFENVAIERINILRKKKEIIDKANTNELSLNESVWEFITSNQVDEVFPFLLGQFNEAVNKDTQFRSANSEFTKQFTSPFKTYVEALPDERKMELLFEGLKNQENEQVALTLSEYIRDHYLFDFDRTMTLLNSEDFIIQKRGVRTAVYDKPFYNKDDIGKFKLIIDFLENNFPERGKKTTKKQLLSSKEKEVWTCECGKTNDIGEYCSGCGNDIHGFKKDEAKPNLVQKYLAQKIELISEFVK